MPLAPPVISAVCLSKISFLENILFLSLFLSKMILMRHFFILFAIAGLLINPSAAEACTGITLKSKDSTTIVARTIEWGGSNLNSQYVVVPRGYTERSYTPNGVDGMTFTARYGYVGLAVEQKEFIAEGLNEVGLRLDCFIFQSTVNMRNISRSSG